MTALLAIIPVTLLAYAVGFCRGYLSRNREVARLNSLLRWLLLRCGQQCEILARNAERKDATK